MNGAPALLACATVVVLGAAMCTVNALSILHDSARAGETIAPWRPWATEYTSLLGLVAAAVDRVLPQHPSQLRLAQDEVCFVIVPDVCYGWCTAWMDHPVPHRRSRRSL